MRLRQKSLCKPEPPFWRCRNPDRKQCREWSTAIRKKPTYRKEISNHLSFAPCGGKHSTCSWFFELVDDDRRADKANQAKEHGRDGVGQPCDHCAYHSGTHRQNHPSDLRHSLLRQLTPDVCNMPKYCLIAISDE